MRRIFNSVPEFLSYALLILIIIFNVVGVAISISQINELKSLAAQNHRNTEEIERQQNCIAAFFLQPSRTGLTLSDLGVCGNVVNGIKH